jgi:hypothetical protein
MSALEIYVLLSPAIVVAIGLIAAGITLWMDARDDRRKRTERTALSR